MVLPPIISSHLPKKHHVPIKATETSKSIFSIFTSRRSLVLAYSFTFIFVACTFFLAFNPSSSSNYFFNSSLWLNKYFLGTTYDNSTNSPQKAHFTSIFSQFFYNSSSNFSYLPNISIQVSKESSPINNISYSDENVISVSQDPNYTSKNKSPLSLIDGVNEIIENVTIDSLSLSNIDNNKDYISQQQNEREKKEDMENQKITTIISHKTSVPKKKSKRGKFKKWVEKMKHCNIFDGGWVKDNSYPLFQPGSCPHIDEPFNCFINGRPDNGYQKYRWQPKHCNIPRLNGKYMLELLKGKRVVFIGDSLNRNMWESMVCILRNSAKDKSKVFEASGIEEFKRDEGFYSFVFEDYNCSVEFSRSNFLVQEWEMPHTNGSNKETLRIDMVERSIEKYKNADVLVFNTGHWWTHEKTSSGIGYYQEGDHIHDELSVDIAFRKAMVTWVRWVKANVDPSKTLVVFRSYSVSHFRGGEWNSGGRCDGETEPLKEETEFEVDPSMVQILESVLEKTRIPVFYLNVTRMTNFRKDAHPSIYREQDLPEEEKKSPLRYQDCSHWCLPGVPDTWNEIIYSQLLLKHKKNQQKQKRHVQRKKP